MKPTLGSRGFVLVFAFAGAEAVAPARAQTTLLGELRGMFPPEPDSTYAVAFGDVDGDGDLDAFVANAGQDRLHLNDGTGVFSHAAGHLPVLDDVSTSVALGDVDGDGDLDALVATAYATSPNRLLLNAGSGMFTEAPALIPGHTDDTRAIAFGDVDGDGDLDALAANLGQNRLFLNDGTGAFSDATWQLPVLSDYTYAVAFGDVDGDGDLDAYSGNYGSPDRLYVNNGAGIFGTAAWMLPPDAGGTYAVAFGDVDGDGDLDALLGRNGQNRLYLNGGLGAFTDATGQLPAVVDGTSSVALADVDGDGDLDAVFGNYEPGRLLVNDGAGTFADAPSQFPATLAFVYAIALGDVDGDGDLDALFGTRQYYDGARNRLLLNDGVGTFVDAASAQPAGFDAIYAAVLGDVDDDGDLDALLGVGGSSGQDRLYLNDGSGVFADVTAQLPAVSDDTRAVALGDVDGDGDLDALIGNAGLPNNPQPVRLYRNDGSGSFTFAPVQPPGPATWTYAIALGDVDGDGDLDAFLGGGSGRLLLNDGTGVFLDATSQIPYGPGSVTSAAFGDLDGDGDLDLFIGAGVYGYSGLDRFFRNNGVGFFSDATNQLPTILDDTRAVALGDVDGDGDLDVLIGNYLAPDRLYRNDGTGFFTDTTGYLPVFIDPTLAVALGDLDGDGDLDALIGNGTSTYYGVQDRLYLNNGTGVFVDSPASMPVVIDNSRAAVLGDLDGDGDLDALIGKSGQPNLVLANITRQLARRGVPRVGKPLVLDAYGPAWGIWLLAFSLGTATVPVPPLGTLRLDPAGELHVVFTGILDVQGRGAVTLAVPADAALVGATLYWQALVTSPARLTNLEATTLTNL